MKRNSFLMVAALVAVAFAGCTSGGGPSDAGENSDVSGPGGVADADTGNVVGVVVDDSIRPLAGAEVGIPELSIETTTNEDGSFELTGLEPGTYGIAAQKLGYDSAAKRVNVVAGEVTEVNIELTAVAIVDPFVDVQTWTGYIECQVGTAAVLANCLPIQNIINQNNLPNPTNTEQIGFFFVAEPRNETVGGLYEMIWQKSTAYTAEELSLGVEPENTGLGGGYEREQGPSVLRVEITDNEPYVSVDPSDPDNDEVQVRVFAAGTNPPTAVVDQRFDVWSSVFYHAHPGEAYTALGDV